MVQWHVDVVPSIIWIKIRQAGRGSIVLRHSAPHVPLNFRGIMCWVTNSRHAFPRHQSKEIKILNISFPWTGIESTTCRVTVSHFTPRFDSIKWLFYEKYYINSQMVRQSTAFSIASYQCITIPWKVENGIFQHQSLRFFYRYAGDASSLKYFYI